MDHDLLFKELIRTFFWEFILLFLPDMARYLDPEGITFLDKEIFTDLAPGERHEVDLLAKVSFRDKSEGFLLVLIESQSSPQRHFGRRMFSYFSRLHLSHLLPVYPIAILSFDAPTRPEPDRYHVSFPDRVVLDFSFHVIQLNRLHWREFLRNPNPVAAALMTKMQIDPADRPRVKLECLRMLVTLKLDKARSMLITVFMESYLKLTAAESIVYNRELEQIEPKQKEAVMQFTNEWIEQGRAQGLIEGRLQARREEALRLLSRRIGSESIDWADRVNKLNDRQLDDLFDALFDFHNLEDATAWFASH